MTHLSINEDFHRILLEARWRLQKQDLAAGTYRANMLAYEQEEKRLLNAVELRLVKAEKEYAKTAKDSLDKSHDGRSNFGEPSERAIRDTNDTYKSKSSGRMSRRSSTSQELFDRTKAALAEHVAERGASATGRRDSDVFCAKTPNTEMSAFEKKPVLQPIEGWHARRASEVATMRLSPSRMNVNSTAALQAERKRPTGLRKRPSSTQPVPNYPISRRPSTATGVTR